MKQEENNKKKKRVRHILIGTGIGLGVLGLGFGWWYFFGRKEKSNNADEIERELTDREPIISDTKTTTSPPRYVLPKAVQQKAQAERFPLRYGDRGSLVKKLQEGLIKLYGESILPNYGADGDFRKEMAAALKSKGLPETIDKATFDKIVAGQPVATAKPPQAGKLPVKQGVDIAKNIWLNATLRKNDGMVEQLKRIRNLDDYRMVDALMKTVGERKSIAEISEIAATDDTGRQLIVNELQRIGLKYKDEKWVLSGIDRAQIVTNSQTIIRDRAGVGIEVPAETLLGEALSSSGAITTFRTIDGQILYVPTKNIYHV
jgi:hypothetical protein